MKKKVLIITYYWPPSGGAGVQRNLKFVKYLSQLDAEPIVITVDADKASYPVTDPGLLKDVPAGIKIHRTNSFEPLKLISSLAGKEKIPHAGFANQKKNRPINRLMRWVRGNFFIPDARKGWVNYAFAKACEIIGAERIDTVIISSPPHSSQLIGLKLKRKFGPSLRWIADMRDPWTDVYYYNDLLPGKSARAKDEQYEREVLEKCDVVVVVSDDIKRLFASKSEKVPASKIHVIPNGFDEEDFSDKTAAPADRFVITYTGTIADSYQPEVFFKVMKEIISTGNDHNIEMQFIGSSAATVRSFADKYGLSDRIRFFPYVTHDEAVKRMMDSSALLLVIPEVKNNKGILTGKLFEYLASERAIIGIGPVDGDAAKIMHECEAGEMFDRENEKGLRDHILKLLDLHASGRPLRNANGNYRKFSRKELTAALRKLL
jgi:glycosyltransferase involved in cell wall biosynthesis